MKAVIPNGICSYQICPEVLQLTHADMTSPYVFISCKEHTTTVSERKGLGARGVHRHSQGDVALTSDKIKVLRSLSRLLRVTILKELRRKYRSLRCAETGHAGANSIFNQWADCILWTVTGYRCLRSVSGNTSLMNVQIQQTSLFLVHKINLLM